MSSPIVSPALSRARHAALVGLWLASVSLAVIDHIRDPYDPSRVGTAQYGHNSEGALAVVVPLMLVELAAALAILRPASYHRAWGRAGAAFVVFLVWGAASSLATMHAGGVVAIHALWVLALALVSFIAMLRSLIARRSRST